ncbi:MAG: YeeE/YedE family protein [Burkholderiales bacterium]|nr:YeeE/YedE family protein [Burkholderiales bacterium]MDE1927112.1 YeeE/YedE family protein [Burkholderiales bacterium]MDE2079979.1 YeeE/YedE family protein [Burkholderiales bacterium]MDE2504593.1 YeeE/YedE family protein [Burkholderiales bacterium]
MGIEALTDYLGEGRTLALIGLVVGAGFGFMAQRSRFCLRSAVVEFARNHPGGKLTVWLFAFATATLLTQLLAWTGALDPHDSRLIAVRGSLSGAIVGGLLFGAGMILARGCSSRLLVLAAQGNLRSLISGLVFAVSAQAAMTGILAPLREGISAWWTIDGGTARDILARSGLGPAAGLAWGALWLVAAVVWARRQSVQVWGWAGAVGVGLTIAAAWWATAAIVHVSFDPHPVQSLSFTGPSAEVLTRVLFAGDKPPTFDLGLVPGVFIGAFAAAAIYGELELVGFQGGASMRRYIAGALCMGFGGMLAGGCAVGAGLSGTSIFALTSYLALCGMWAGGALTDRLLDQHPVGPLPQPMARDEAPSAAFTR